MIEAIQLHLYIIEYKMAFSINNKNEAKIVYLIIAIIAFVEGLQVLARLAYQYYFKDDL